VRSEVLDIMEKNKKEEGAAVSSDKGKQTKKVKKSQQIANHKHLLHVSFICVT